MTGWLRQGGGLCLGPGKAKICKRCRRLIPQPAGRMTRYCPSCKQEVTLERAYQRISRNLANRRRPKRRRKR